LPISGEFTQLETYLGGAAVAGGKMKKEGLTYFNTPNTGATNESGFTSLGSGWRMQDGTFTEINTTTLFISSDAWYIRSKHDTAASLITSQDSDALKKRGFSLRLFRNSPVGADRRTITATSTANISSTALQVAIPFGYMVEAIRITNLQPATNLTTVSATHNNTAGASLGTLITGKTVNAATSSIFPCALLDMPSQVTDGTVRLIATGNQVQGLRIDVILRKTMTI
jgi:hypothetical protein